MVTVFGGSVAILVDIAPGSAADDGGIALGFALVLGRDRMVLAPALGEPDDGDDVRRRPRPGADTRRPTSRGRR